MVDITTSESKALSYIAMNGPVIGYTLHQNAGLTSKTAYTAPKSLKDKGLLQTSISGKTRAGLDKKQYHLTILGFSHALLQASQKNWSRIIARWADLVPLVFKKWSVFDEKDVKDLAIRNLERSAFLTKLIGFENPMKQVEDFTSNFYNPFVELRKQEERIKFMSACAKDSEIRIYVAGLLRSLIESYERGILEVYELMQALEE